MKYANPRILYRCAGCGTHTTTLHELVPGHGNRKICEHYNVQLPLCPYCHLAAHNRHGEIPKEIKKIGFQEKTVNQIIGCYENIFGMYFSHIRAEVISTKKERPLLESHKSIFAQIIKSYEVY